MAAKKDEPKALVVSVPFAYATAKSGEVVQHVRGDVLDPAQYDEKSLEHLRSIGFLGDQD
jgi:hypothetical protein